MKADRMPTGWLLSVSCISMVVGAIVTILGLGLLAAFFSAGGGPLGGIVLYILVALVGGSLLVLGGPGVIYAAIKLLGGYAWARSALEVFWWSVLVLTAGYLAYRASAQSYFLPEHFIRGALFFAGTGVPSILMLWLLRSDAIRRALVR